MKRHANLWTAAGCTAALAALLTLPAIADEQEGQAPTTALAQWYGRNSAVKHEAWVVAREPEALKALWIAHFGDDHVERAAQGWVQPPEVDFDRCMVVAVFNKPRINCNGERMVSAQEKDDHVLIRYETITYQTASFGNEEIPTVNPWGMFLVPRSDKPVVIEENTQNIIGEPPVWTERARIEWPAAKGGWFVPGAKGGPRQPHAH